MALSRFLMIGLIVGLAFAEERAILETRQAITSSADMEVAAAVADATGNIYVAGRTHGNGMGTRGAFQRASKAKSNLGLFDIGRNRVRSIAATGSFLGSADYFRVDPSDNRHVCESRGIDPTVHCSANGGKSWTLLRGFARFRNWGGGGLTSIYPNALIGGAYTSESWPWGPDPLKVLSTDGGRTFQTLPKAPGTGESISYFHPLDPCRVIDILRLYRKDQCDGEWTAMDKGMAIYPNLDPPYHPDPNAVLGVLTNAGGGMRKVLLSRDWGATWSPLLDLPAGYIRPAVHPGRANTWLSRDESGSWRVNTMAGLGWELFADLPSRADIVPDYACGVVYVIEYVGGVPVISITDAHFGPRRRILQDVSFMAFAPCRGAYYRQKPTSDAFVAKFDPQGQLQRFTYLGGDGNETVRSVAVDGNGDVYVSGWSEAPDFPTTYELRPGAKGFVVKLSGDLKRLLFSTRIPAQDGPEMKLGQDGSIYLLGMTQDLMMPVAGKALWPRFEPGFDPKDAGDGNGYLVRMGGDGRSLLYSTTLGRGYPRAFDLSGEESVIVYQRGVLSGAPAEQRGDFHKIDLRAGKVEWTSTIPLFSPLPMGITVRASGDILVWGGTPGAALPLAPGLGAFQAEANPYRLSGIPPPVTQDRTALMAEGTIARLRSDGAAQGRTFLGGIGRDWFTGALEEEDGSVIGIGATEGLRFNTRSMTDQRLRDTPAGFVVKLDGKMQKAAFSTVLTDFVPAAVVRHPEGGYWLIGSGKNDPDGLGANGIVLARMTVGPAKLPRIDRVVRDGNSAGWPGRLDLLWPEAVVDVYGEGFGESPVVTVAGIVMESRLVEPGRVRFTVPAGHAGGVFALVVEAGGERSDGVGVRVE